MQSHGNAVRLRCLAGVVLAACPVATRGFLVTTPSHHIVYRLGQSLEDNSERPAQRGWRRALRKALRPKKSRKDSVFTVSQKDGTCTSSKGVTAMQMATSLEDELVTNRLLLEFERFSPSDVFPNLSIDHLGMAHVSTNHVLESTESKEDAIFKVNEYDDELLVNLDEMRSKMKSNKIMQDATEHAGHRSTVINLAVKNFIENFVLGLFDRWSVERAHSLEAVVIPKGNVLSRLLRGKFKGDAKVVFNKLVLKPIQLSSGTIQAKRMMLNLWSFTPDFIRKGVIRYPAQFDFYFTDCVFSQDDLVRSVCIRNGLQQLLVRVLTRAGVSPTHVVVNSIRLLPSGKISCSGEAATAFSGLIPFEVRSRIDLTCRGHVITFPGLEVSLQPSLGLFVPVLPEIDLDIGHNARLISLQVDGIKKTLTMSAKATVTPDHTLKLKKYLQAKESYAAHFTFDVGQWITKIGNFSR